MFRLTAAVAPPIIVHAAFLARGSTLLEDPAGGSDVKDRRTRSWVEGGVLQHAGDLLRLKLPAAVRDLAAAVGRELHAAIRASLRGAGIGRSAGVAGGDVAGGAEWAVAGRNDVEEQAGAVLLEALRSPTLRRRRRRPTLQEGILLRKKT